MEMNSMAAAPETQTEIQKRHQQSELKELYSLRFAGTRDYRGQVWKILVNDFFPPLDSARTRRARYRLRPRGVHQQRDSRPQVCHGSESGGEGVPGSRHLFL